MSEGKEAPANVKDRSAELLPNESRAMSTFYDFVQGRTANRLTDNP